MDGQKRKTWIPANNREDDRRGSCEDDRTAGIVNELLNTYRNDGLHDVFIKEGAMLYTFDFPRQAGAGPWL